MQFTGPTPIANGARKDTQPTHMAALAKGMKYRELSSLPKDYHQIYSSPFGALILPKRLSDRDPNLDFLLQAIIKVSHMEIFSVQQLHVSDEKCPRSCGEMENSLELMTSLPRYTCCVCVCVCVLSSVTSKMGLVYEKGSRGELF